MQDFFVMDDSPKSYNPILPRAILIGFYIAMVIGFVHMMEYITHIRLTIGKFHINYLVFFALVYFGVKIFRDHKLDGTIAFSKAMALGVLSCGIAGFLLGLNYYIYATSVHLSNTKVMMAEWINLGDRNPNSAVVFIILFTLIVGFIFSIIVAVILNKQQK
ncbi:DUF4199 domain-containing protein [Solitalea koreensis]|uniref:DUF4199 domain-containing protein n=1 Tax=Solitalea koreensis TaxID=543615 RepID=A0A521BK27_9SPHI|nr:DUF4199 domain-containing protein [Solitalea koreensis]SMO47432.1 Protein of unknown function [Solitalea koreensis]